MKITQDHYNRLAKGIEEAIKEDYPGLSPEDFSTTEKYRWALFNRMCDKDQYWLARELWEYLDDDNIDTALKKITGTR